MTESRTSSVTITGPTGSTTFDATIAERHASRSTVSEHQVERGSPVADHIRGESYEMSLTVTMTEMDGSEEPSRDFRLLAELAELHAARLPVSVDTYLGSRDSMAIVGVSTPIEARDGRSVTAVVSLKEVRVVDSVQTAVPKEFIAAIMRPDTEAQERRGRDDAGGDADSLGVRLLGGQDRARELLRIRVDADGNPL